MDIIGVKNPYSLVQQAGRRKRRTYRKKNTLRSKTLRKTRRHKK
jgi:hypothetical protein